VEKKQQTIKITWDISRDKFVSLFQPEASVRFSFFSF
jgi:hypothetical protein